MESFKFIENSIYLQQIRYRCRRGMNRQAIVREVIRPHNGLFLLARPGDSSSRIARTSNGYNDTSFQPIARALKRFRTVSRRKHWGGLCENHSWGETPMRTVSSRSSADCPRLCLMSGSRGRIGQRTTQNNGRYGILPYLLYITKTHRRFK